MDRQPHQDRMQPQMTFCTQITLNVSDASKPGPNFLAGARTLLEEDLNHFPSFLKNSRRICPTRSWPAHLFFLPAYGAPLRSITVNKPLCSSLGSQFPSSSSTTKTFVRACLCTAPARQPTNPTPPLRLFPKRLLFGFINFTTRKTPGPCPINSRSVTLGTKSSTFYKRL